MFRDHLGAGLSAIRRHPGLAALLFLVNAVLAYAVSAPIGAALNASFAGSGYVPDMVEALDLPLLADFFEENSGLVPTIFALLAWMVPILFIWSTASGVGLVHALRDGGGRPFWSGVTAFFARGLGLALLYLICVIGWTILVGLGVFASTLMWPGEVAGFWALLVIGPGVWAIGLGLLDMMLDYARFGLVARGMAVVDSFIFGLTAPIRLRGAAMIYLIWFVPAAILTLLPTFPAGWLGAAFSAFILQQIFLAGRAAITIGWMGSQVSLAERQVPEKKEPGTASIAPGSTSKGDQSVSPTVTDDL